MLQERNSLKPLAEMTNKNQLVSENLRIWHKIRRTMAESDTLPWLKININRGQLRILLLVFKNNQLCPGSMANILAISKANITQIMKLLVRQGLVFRERDSRDRRKYSVHLTEKGRSEVETLQGWSSSRMQHVFAKIPEDDLKVIMHGLEIMLTAAQQSIAPPAKGGQSLIDFPHLGKMF